MSVVVVGGCPRAVDVSTGREAVQANVLSPSPSPSPCLAFSHKAIQFPGTSGSELGIIAAGSRWRRPNGLASEGYGVCKRGQVVARSGLGYHGRLPCRAREAQRNETCGVRGVPRSSSSSSLHGVSTGRYGVDSSYRGAWAGYHWARAAIFGCVGGHGWGEGCAVGSWRLPSSNSEGRGRRGERRPKSNTKRGAVIPQAKRGESVDYGDRIIASVAYFLPFLDGVDYGRYLLREFPLMRKAISPLAPVISVYNSIPFGSFIAFFVLYLAVVQNTRYSRFVRFNTMQAITLDILLILPRLIERLISPSSGFAIRLFVIFYNTVFLFLLSSFVFGVVSCILGKTARLPLVGDAADQQIM